jgi:hypothetical protein
VIALGLTAKRLSIDSENHLLSKLNNEWLNDFENVISRCQYIDHRKVLFKKTETMRKLMLAIINSKQMYLQLI